MERTLERKCKFCGEQPAIVDSHSIPDGIFRTILKASNGSAISIPIGPGPISGSNDTGKAPILCSECEDIFNKSFDGPLVNAMRKLDKEIQLFGHRARTQFSHNQLAQAIVSILWRCCESDAPMYAGAEIETLHKDELKRIIQANSSDTLKSCSISFRRLTDSTAENNGGFDQASIAQIIVPPTPRRYAIKGKLRGYGFDMVFQGFLMHLTIPRLPHNQVRASGFLKHGAKILHAPPINIFDYKPLVDVLVHAYSKFDSGQMTTRASKT